MPLNQAAGVTIIPAKKTALFTATRARQQIQHRRNNFHSVIFSGALPRNLWYTFFALNTAVVLCGPSGS